MAWNTIGRGDCLSENKASHSKSELNRSPDRSTCASQTRLAGLEAEIAAGESIISSAAEPYIWIWAYAPYLREQAQRCTRLCA